MPFPFSSICDLLNRLERLKLRDPPYLPEKLREETTRAVEEWFRRHRTAIDSRETDGVALLSTLFPERRTDRVYGLKETSLCKVLARCLHLTNKKSVDLQAWKIPGHGDLGMCLENVLKSFDDEPKPGKPGTFVTVEQTNRALDDLASQCHFSAPAMRNTFPASSPPDILGSVFLRLKSSEAKWMTRLILKDLSPTFLDETLILREFHFLLPGLLHFQDSFAAAIPLLRGPLRRWHAKPDLRSQRIFKKEAAELLCPQVGVKVGRPPFMKARSMANAVQMAGCQRWSVERKYDGEYCEVHIDLDKGDKCIQIFSKSGKDSTSDRKGVHDAIRKCLKIGQKDCFFRKRCIVVGELVVWSEKHEQILGFEKIRKHVSRSGVSIGTDEDSQRHPWERLMVVFFDVLLIDDDVIMRKPHAERRNILSTNLIRKIKGYGVTAEWKIIDFSCPEEAPNLLCREFAAALSYRVEGLVMKPSDMPYFAFDDDRTNGKRGYFIKVKKDYMQELGGERDVADFAVVGASYDPKQAHKSGVRNVQYTTFHLGCLVNEESLRFPKEKPIFEVVGMISQEQCIPKSELQALNDYGRFCSRPFDRSGNRLREPDSFDLILDHNPTSKMAVVFTDPFVVEVLGSSFEKPSNKSYYMFRHPRILKLHLDRNWKDATTLSSLERMADEARSAPVKGESQELSQLTKKFINKFESKRGKEKHGRVTATQSTRYTTSPDSAQRSSRSVRRSPTLVRIDTADLLPGEMRGARSDGSFPIIVLENSGETLPTPPGSSEGDTFEKSIFSQTPTVTPRSSKRRKEEAATPPTLKRVCTEKNNVLGSRPLSDISDKSIRNGSNITTAAHNPPHKSSSNRHPLQETELRLAKQACLDSCNNPKCPFSQAVAYLSPCISSYKWVTDSLLPWHNVERTDRLIHWQRETLDLPPLGPMLPESPAWPGLQKIILLETNRIVASMACVDEVKELRIRDDVWFFDWRVLEELRSLGEDSSETGNDILRKHYFGCTKWEKQRMLVMFHKAEDSMAPIWDVEA
jgi:DNA ligase-4